MVEPRKRTPSEVLKRGYSDEELNHIYELSRLLLESGDFRRAETILHGINEVAPDFGPAWLGMAFVRLHEKDYDKAATHARQALRINTDSVEAMLFLACALLSTGDYNSAGTQLGEIGERIESGAIDQPNLVRFYRAQLVRYQSRATA
jgi:tetratricopeptide (TPR) repeat protein